MNQNNRHHFQDRDIEVKWRIEQKIISQQNTDLPQQQVPYEISLENNPDMEIQPGFVGGRVNFTNGQSFVAQIQEQTNLCYIFDQQSNNWVTLQQKIDEYQQKQQQPQQLIPIQNQGNSEQGLVVEVVNYENFNEYEGFISEKDFENQTESLADLDDLNKEIADNIKNIFNNSSPVQLKLKNQDSSLDVKLLLAKGKKTIEYNIKISLNLKEQNPEEQEKRRKEKEVKKQNEKFEKIEKNLEKLQSDTAGQNQIVNQIKQDLNSLKFDVAKQIQQVEQKLNIQCQQLIQKQQNPYKKISLNQLQLAQQQDGNIYTTKLFNGQYELELSIIDDEADFEVGILADGDLQNIEKKKGSYYISLPEGTFKRGTTEYGKLLTYKLQIDDILGVRVDINKHLLQVIINDYQLPPIRINDAIEDFSFFIRSQNECSEFSGDTQV
ncbi:unnamed protein product (macronuclear) [Paramecium tetraurelia]|uniref:GOLD domain-containing protein n=1 Tax=Paramecium tetraurelia TaxID=5888 RepID=A0BTH7_PARTE|nr:uncharacterized protein GSPATT00032076001 [Paramecium tetraurelia]CAK61844.1 unnamed protein product [Paramecium tetraurelia]|eukprot:XP_001429242.1 hypothetical protein (macronuclear) [Paramecium tetraurelia strain d4-2]